MPLILGSNVGNGGSKPRRGIGILCPWVDKKKNIRIRNVARQPESNLVSGGSGGGSGNPISEEVDMEILRGLENLGAPWDSMVDSRGPTELFGPLVPS